MIDLDFKAAMPAHHIVQKLSSSKNCFVRYWLYLRPHSEIVKTNNQVAISIISGSPHKATPTCFKTLKGTGMLWFSALNPIVSDNFRKS